MQAGAVAMELYLRKRPEPAHPLLFGRRIRRFRRRVKRLVDRVGNVRPATKLLSPVVIDSYSISGEAMRIEDVYMFMKDSDLTLTVKTRNRSPLPHRAWLYVTLMGSQQKKLVTYAPRKTMTMNFKYEIDRAAEYPLDIELRRWVYSSNVFDSVSDTIPIGVLDQSLKPTSEYPEDDALNTVLINPVDWQEKSYVYPQPKGDVQVSVENMRFKEGFVKYSGRMYRRTDVEAVVELPYSFKNTGSQTLSYIFGGVGVGVVYSDLKHVSLYDMSVNATGYSMRGELKPGETLSGAVRVPIPLPAYGHVFAFVVYYFNRGGMLAYGGGPVWQVDIYRAIMP